MQKFGKKRIEITVAKCFEQIQFVFIIHVTCWLKFLIGGNVTQYLIYGNSQKQIFDEFGFTLLCGDCCSQYFVSGSKIPKSYLFERQNIYTS